jgi:hypothetical protein
LDALPNEITNINNDAEIMVQKKRLSEKEWYRKKKKNVIEKDVTLTTKRHKVKANKSTSQRRKSKTPGIKRLST